MAEAGVVTVRPPAKESGRCNCLHLPSSEQLALNQKLNFRANWMLRGRLTVPMMELKVLAVLLTLTVP